MGVGQVRAVEVLVTVTVAGGGGGLIVVLALVVVGGGSGEQAGDGCCEARNQAEPAEVGPPAGVRQPRGRCQRPARGDLGVTVSIRRPVGGGRGGRGRGVSVARRRGGPGVSGGVVPWVGVEPTLVGV